MPKPRSSKDRPDPNLHMRANPALSYLNNAFFVLVGVAIAVGAAILAYTQL